MGDESHKLAELRILYGVFPGSPPESEGNTAGMDLYRILVDFKDF